MTYYCLHGKRNHRAIPSEKADIASHKKNAVKAFFSYLFITELLIAEKA
jgi:hypothetical protein